MNATKILLLFLFPSLAFAQFSRGQIYTTGSISFSNQVQNYTFAAQQNTNQSSGNQFSIAMAMGVFVNSKVAVGGSVGHMHSYQETDFSTGSQNSKVNSFNGNLFLRRYYKISDSFYFSAEGKVQYGNSVSDSYQNNSGFISAATDKYHSFSLNLTPFFIFFPSKTWAFEAGVGSVGYNIFNSSGSYHGHGFAFSFGTINLGLSYYFKRKE